MATDESDEHPGRDQLAATAAAVRNAWDAAQAGMPTGWSVDSLRCASRGLDLADRSDEWVAVPIGPRGEEQASRAEDAVTALNGLVRDVREAIREARMPR